VFSLITAISGLEHCFESWLLEMQLHEALETDKDSKPPIIKSRGKWYFLHVLSKFPKNTEYRLFL
jgi:hypothetical protein